MCFSQSLYAHASNAECENSARGGRGEDIHHVHHIHHLVFARTPERPLGRQNVRPDAIHEWMCPQRSVRRNQRKPNETKRNPTRPNPISGRSLQEVTVRAHFSAHSAHFSAHSAHFTAHSVHFSCKSCGFTVLRNVTERPSADAAHKRDLSAPFVTFRDLLRPFETKAEVQLKIS